MFFMTSEVIHHHFCNNHRPAQIQGEGIWAHFLTNEYELHIIRKICKIGDSGAIILEKYNLLQAVRERNEIDLAPGAIFNSLVLCKVAISSTGPKRIAKDN